MAPRIHASDDKQLGCWCSYCTNLPRKSRDCRCLPYIWRFSGGKCRQQNLRKAIFFHFFSYPPYSQGQKPAIISRRHPLTNCGDYVFLYALPPFTLKQAAFREKTTQKPATSKAGRTNAGKTRSRFNRNHNGETRTGCRRRRRRIGSCRRREYDRGPIHRPKSGRTQAR